MCNVLLCKSENVSGFGSYLILLSFFPLPSLPRKGSFTRKRFSPLSNKRNVFKRKILRKRTCRRVDRKGPENAGFAPKRALLCAGA